MQQSRLNGNIKKLIEISIRLIQNHKVALLARLKKEQELCGEYGPNKDLYYVLNHPSPIKELHKYINSLEGV